jgi:hypothetical protein
MKSIFLKSLIVALSIFYAGIGCAAMQPVEVFTPNSPALTKMNNLGVDTFYNAAINTLLVTNNNQCYRIVL